MISVNEKFDLLSEDELHILKNRCDEFTLSESPNIKESEFHKKLQKNFYHRNHFRLDDNQLQSIIGKVTSYVKNISYNSDIKLSSIWINKVTNETNKNDSFHKDSSYLTFLLYLNENFTGGEFEYINSKNKKVQITPKTNLSIVSNYKLNHRVLPVLDGIRFSLVMFFDVQNKKETTLI